MTTLLRALAVALTLAAGAAPVRASQPSFSCAKPAGKAQQLVCADAELARLDRELARLYGLALKAGNTARHPDLKPMQRGWIKGRDDCWKDDDVRICVRDRYVERIVELRRESGAAARRQDAQGIVVGPLALRCPGIDAPLTLSFVNSDPGALVLSWGERSLVLNPVRSGSGARYERQYPDGRYMIWNKGRDYSVELPGSKPVDCSEPPAAG